ncbi:serine protease [Nocardioides sp. MH1]|uniref:trypsin-like serine peptidase n=1 Tax=Nocardioides sp. MH1 TaxID=3242490 RepID=UPI0035202268
MSAAPTPADARSGARTAAVPARHAVVTEAPTAAGTAREISSYWTSARMRAALPIEQLVDGLTRSLGPGRSAEHAARARTRPRQVRAPRSTGKLFFRVDGADAVCTASAINTKKRNQVITAGHCVHTGPDVGLLQQPHFYSDWVYVPRYRNGHAPYGKWVANNAYAFNGWIEHEAFRFDQAIISFKRHGRHRLVDVTGGNDVVWGKPQREWGVRIWGWPAEDPFDGETAKRCDGRTVPFHDSADASMHACALTGGASGGPWFLPRGRTANSGRIWAVTSRRVLERPVLLARPIPSEIRRMIRAANR